jgi:hypothetical protein
MSTNNDDCYPPGWPHQAPPTEPPSPKLEPHFISVLVPKPSSERFRAIPINMAGRCVALVLIDPNQGIAAMSGIAACLREIADGLEKDPDYLKDDSAGQVAGSQKDGR